MSDIFSKLLSLSWPTIVILAVLLLAGVSLYLGKKRFTWNAAMLAQGAICIAMAFILSYIRLFRMQSGGSITVASMLPICAFAFSYGVLPGSIVSVAYGLLQMIQDPYFVHPVQILVDYILAFGFFAVAGLARKLPEKPFSYRLAVGVVLAGIGRYAMAVVSGVVFFGEYAPEGQSALVYSLVYNITYIGPDVLFCALVCLIPGVEKVVRRLGKSGITAART